jgi:glycosyltransferase involved in cell wall biosynthesis
MKFSIITPTLQRESLIKTCESISGQSCMDWQHLVMIDCEKPDGRILSRIPFNPQRRFTVCGTAHKNFGNRCRHDAWAYATGEYVLYLDDDNWLTNERVLENIAAVLTGNWGFFPILRHGQIFYTDQPRSCHADTANVVVKREIGRWPDGPEYTMDGIWIDALMKNYPNYQAFPNFRPIVVMPSSNEGR